MTLPGEKELAGQFLDLTKTARKQEATIPEQCKILHQMGELYLKDANKTGNGDQFVKASALINAALVRTEYLSDQHVLQELLCDIYKGLGGNFQEATLGFSVEELAVKANSNKDDLHAIRVEIYELSRHLEQLFDSYRMVDYIFLPTGGDKKEQIPISSMPDIKYFQFKTEKEIVQETKKVSDTVQRRMLEFMNSLWKQAIEISSVPPPCQYAVIGLGSLARQESTPYSDLEFALLVENDSIDTKEYFKHLVYLFHLQILDLGETPIPAMAIESLNDFLSPDGDKFFDIITQFGFRLDGAMPWACKTPIGRKPTPQREPLDLIKTPEEMAALLREDNVLGQAYHVADILCNSILIIGDSSIYDEYISFCDMALSKTDHKEKARRSLVEDYNRSPDWSIKRFSAYNLQSKQSFYRFPSIFVENLRMYYTPQYQANSNWKVLDHLFEENILSAHGTFNLRIQLAICYGFRLLTYLKNRGQCENFGFMEKESRPFGKVRAQSSLKERSKCRIAHFKNKDILDRLYQGSDALRSIVETYFMETLHGRVKNLKEENFIRWNEELDPNPFAWTRNAPTFGNLQWARVSKELPSKGCGRKCEVNCLYVFSQIPSQDFPAMLKALEEILKVTCCKCLLLIRRSLLVSKAILIKRCQLIKRLPKEANIYRLLKCYKQKRYKNVRERFYLLLDISDLSHFIDNTDIQMTVTVMTEAFSKDIVTFEESQQRMVNMMKHDLVENMISLSRMTGQFDKGIQLCQQQIDREEMALGVDGGEATTGKWYFFMGNIKEKCGLS